MAVSDIYEVIQTPQAEEHIRQIVHYVAVNLKNPDAAYGFLDKIDLLDEYLMKSPQKCGFIDVYPWNSFIHKTVIEGT